MTPQYISKPVYKRGVLGSHLQIVSPLTYWKIKFNASLWVLQTILYDNAYGYLAR